MNSKIAKISIVALFLLVIVALAYWQFFVRNKTTAPANTGQPNTQGFVPFGRTPAGTNQGQNSNPDSGTYVNTQPAPIGAQDKIPTLRLLSDTPVGGYGASTTGAVSARPASTTTAIRWIDRGRGNIYEARGNTLDIATLSNTVVPKIYESLWNKNLTAFAGFGITENGDAVDGFFAQLLTRTLPKASSSTPPQNPGTLTPYELKGKSLPGNILAYAISPKKDKLFLLINNSGTGMGYVSNIDGSQPVQIFTTPLTQVRAEWPADNIISIATKAAADQLGYLYFVDPKTGVWTKVAGPLPGLSAKVSTTGKYAFISAAGSSDNIVTSIYNVATKKGIDGVIRTLADKCVWGNFYKDLVYCAVPSEPIKGIYPDDWYRGTVSFIDKIWQVNAATGEIKLVSSIIETSDRVIDAFNLGLDDKDDFLIFMNKNDLSLWSLDLVSQN